MSEQEQNIDTSGAPAETQGRGFGGERRDRVATDELSPQAEASEQSLSRQVSRETSETPPPPQKNSPTSFYRYLLVLFGAAFLMLLLAYFVQQRNSETAYSDLQNTMNLSREELMEEIQQLETEKDALQKDLERIQNKADQTDEQLKAQEAESKSWFDQCLQTTEMRDRAIALSCLERFLYERDYLMAACVAADCDWLLNPDNGQYARLSEPALPVQTDRYLELRGWLNENGYLLIYEYNDGSKTTETPVVAQGQEVNAAQERRDAAISARNLWSIFYYYLKEDPEAAAMLTAGFYDSELGSNAEYLNTKTFRPSTLALLEQIKADLTEQGRLVETEDGLHYAENGSPVDIPYGELESLMGAGGQKSLDIKID